VDAAAKVGNLLMVKQGAAFIARDGGAHLSFLSVNRLTARPRPNLRDSLIHPRTTILWIQARIQPATPQRKARLFHAWHHGQLIVERAALGFAQVRMSRWRHIPIDGAPPFR